MNKVKIPQQISEEEALAENIHPLIIKPPTKEELTKQQEVANEIRKHAESMLETRFDWMAIDFARRKEEVYRNELDFIANNPTLVGDDLIPRFQRALINLTDALVKQGKLFDAEMVAFEGMKLNVDLIAHYQRIQNYLVAINKPDNELCECGDIAFTEEESQTFGSGQVVSIMPTHQVIDSIPSYKHGGEIVNIIRCSQCGFLNAVPKDSTPNFVLDVNTNPTQQFETRRIDNGSSIRGKIFSSKRLSSTDRK